MKVRWYFVLILLLPPGCMKSRVVDAPTAAEGPEIVRIVGRDRTIIVRSSDQGPRYTLVSGNEELIASVTMDKLERHDPALARELREMLANRVIATGARD